MPSKKGLSQKGHLLGLFFSKVEKQLHIEGNHFLFSFHAMHLRQKSQAEKSSTYPLQPRGLGGATKQASEWSYFFLRTQRKWSIVSRNKPQFSGMEEDSLMFVVMSRKKHSYVFWHEKTVSCSHVYTCVKRNSVHALANTKRCYI